MLTESNFSKKYTHERYLCVAHELRNYYQAIAHQSIESNNATRAAIPKSPINGKGPQRNILMGLIFSRGSTNLPRFKRMTVK